MITNGKCRKDTLEMARRLLARTELPLSVLISPTIMKKQDLADLREAGVDKIGVAIDLATEELFERYRGREVSGPHAWEKYWKTIEEGLSVFGPANVGAHLMVGMGETEKEMISLMDRLWRMGVVSHLLARIIISFDKEDSKSILYRFNFSMTIMMSKDLYSLPS